LGRDSTFWYPQAQAAAAAAARVASQAKPSKLLCFVNWEIWVGGWVEQPWDGGIL